MVAAESCLIQGELDWLSAIGETCRRLGYPAATANRLSEFEADVTRGRVVKGPIERAVRLERAARATVPAMTLSQVMDYLARELPVASCAWDRDVAPVVPLESVDDSRTLFSRYTEPVILWLRTGQARWRLEWIASTEHWRIVPLKSSDPP